MQRLQLYAECDKNKTVSIQIHSGMGWILYLKNGIYILQFFFVRPNEKSVLSSTMKTVTYFAIIIFAFLMC